MTDEHHPETYLFFATRFGYSKVPTWFKRKKGLINDIAHLFTIRQGIVYDGWKPELFKATRYRISRDYKISYSAIDTLLGVCLLDLSEPYGCLYDLFKQAEPSLTRTRRT